MITPIGKFLRKLRIDTGEILKDMAEKLHVSPSFLSAVENGKKKMPSTWNSTICILYQLSADQRAEFTKAIAATEESVTLDLTTFSFPQKCINQIPFLVKRSGVTYEKSVQEWPWNLHYLFQL